MTVFDVITYYQNLPRRYLGAGALITDDNDRILLVEPAYKPTWEIPGGSVDASEAPRTACQRELGEELSLYRTIGPLLVMDHQTQDEPRGDSIMFIYDGGTLDDTLIATLRLPDTELVSFRFVDACDLDQFTRPTLASRIRIALRARHEGTLIECHNSDPLV